MAYDKEKDYKALMDAAAAAGDYKAASQYEQLRNEKIADMGLGYEQTNTYQYDTPVKNVNGVDYYKNGTGYEGYDDGDLINYVTTAPSQLKKDAAAGIGGGAMSGGGGGSLGGFGGFGGASPLWASKYQGQIDALTKSLLNREAFSYNPQSDPLYQNYLDQYTRAGSQAMQDTLGQVSARTGGLASTYATGAAQGAYNNYMQQAADKMPDLYKLAYSMYQDEGNRQMDNIGLLQGLDDTAYGRYADNRDFNYGVSSDEWSRNFEQQQYADQMSQLALENQRYDDETAYSRQQDALAASRKSSSGGGGGGPSVVGGDWDALYNTMLQEAYPEQYLRMNRDKWGIDAGQVDSTIAAFNERRDNESSQKYGYGYSEVNETISNIENSLNNRTFTVEQYIERVKSVIETAYQKGMINEEGQRKLLEALGATDF